MKKRSLFAAVAMLIVSAIVLTSATFAWFQASTQASMASFSAGISNESTGAITISADGTEWKTSLSQADYYVNGDINGSLKAACAGARFPATLTAVSFDVNNATAPAVAGAYDGTEFKPAAVPTTGAYVVYSIQVKADAACTVNATLTSSQTNAPFIWAAIKAPSATATVNANQQNNAARQYAAISSYTTTGEPTNPIDSNADYVVNSNEVPASNSSVTLGGTVISTSNTTNNATVQLTFTGAGTQTVTIYEWCEGQDAACNGTINGSSSISVAFEVA